jgi:putative Mg2+ transporter-C (MgtC) family protein
MILWEALGRLGLSAVFGLTLGLQRASARKPAGVRTHILVGLGATLMTLVSVYGFPGGGFDPTRIAAQIVTGIGFIGAGLIIREGHGVRGLTTAASLWMMAGIGMATGFGTYLLALGATALALVTLMFLGSLDTVVREGRRRAGTLEISTLVSELSVERLTAFLSEKRIPVKQVSYERQEEGKLQVRYNFQIPAGVSPDELLSGLRALGAKGASWESLAEEMD